MENQQSESINLLNKYISEEFRHLIEQKYYAKITAKARIETALNDPAFLAAPLHHLSFSNDHGVVHVRDIALRTLNLLDQLNGIQFPKRNSVRLEFMKGFGIMLAYVHDIGMAEEDSPVYQDFHAQIASQTVFHDSFDPHLSILWGENSGNVAWRLTQLAYKKALPNNIKNILREILALSGLHNTKSCPIERFNELPQLRRLLQEMIAYPLAYQVLQKDALQAEKKLQASQSLEAVQRQKYEYSAQQANEALDHYGKPALNKFLALYYHDFWQDSFQWLASDHPDVHALIEDVLDTVRILRAANASRQRGTKLRATGDHQIFLDHHSANALYAVHLKEKLFLVENPSTFLSGEVNLSSTEYTEAGDLRISFYRGRFSDDQATQRAIYNAAIAINDVQTDMIGSFKREANSEYEKRFTPTYILLEQCDDNPEFSQAVQNQLLLSLPHLKDTVHIVPSLQNAPAAERNRYLSAQLLNWDLKTQNSMLEKIAASGHKIVGMNTQTAFTDVRCANIPAGEILMQAETPASFVYIALDHGLTGYPLGGYAPFHVNPYLPLGNVGVIRGDARNATVVAEAAVKVLMIPKEVYLSFWHHSYTDQEFVQILKSL